MTKRDQREQASGKNFVHLHVHGEYSSLDGMGRTKSANGSTGYVPRAVELGMPAIAMTDHGGVSGLPEFYTECKKAGIEPILGEEFYFVEDAAWRPAKGVKESAERSHITVLARGHAGYQVLAELSTLSHHQYYYKPLIDRRNLEDLGDDARHLTVLSGCAGSMLSEKVLAGDKRGARAELLWWRETFPNFYVELMHHDTSFDRKLNRGLIALAERYDVPWVVTNDPHFVLKDEHDTHDALLAIQVAKPIDDPDRFRFDGQGYHLRSRAEMRQAIEGNYGRDVWVPGARNTLRIAKDCYTDIPGWNKRTWQVPKFPDVTDSYLECKKRAWEFLRERGLDQEPEYRHQLKVELRAARDGGICDFLLITSDVIRYARSKRIPVGPGRGSVVGSLLAWCLYIHKMDPIKHKLLFERFYNPARPKMPDIDTDFSQKYRYMMFEYVEEKYGIENVVAVATFQRMKAKKAFGGLAKAFGYTYTDRMRLSKEIVSDDDPDSADITFLLPDEVMKRTPEILHYMNELVGLKVGVSRHPAGVIIADPDQHVRKQVPELWIASSKTFSGQYDLDQIEHLGLMKQDFLGLRTLDTIDLCVKWVKERHGVDLDVDAWVPDEEPDDEGVYRMLAEGRTAGVFQFEGPTNTRGCKEVKPERFEDLVSITALYRTGAIRAGFPKIFNENRRRGSLKAIPYLHPSLRPILETSWGVVIYQEQVMEMGRAIAGFDMIQVDDIKEAIKHKKGELMRSMRKLFVEGARKTQRIDRDTGNAIFDMIEGYSGYGYNRSHAVAYTFVSYQTARLKYLYPIEFYAALLATVDQSSPEAKEKRDGYLREAVGMGYRVLPPDVNESEVWTSPVGDAIRFGLQDVSGIGEKSALKIVSGRPRKGYRREHHVRRVVQNERTMAALAGSGALAPCGVETTHEAMEGLLRWQFTDKMAPYRKKYKEWILLPDEVEDGQEVRVVGQLVKVTMGKTKEGPKDADGNPKWKSKPYATWTIKYDQSTQFDLRMWNECRELWETGGVGSVVRVRGRWDARWLNMSTADPDDVQFLKKVKASAD